MKTDREFLDGIYVRAEQLQSKNEATKSMPNIILLKYSVPAFVALLLIVITPMMYFNRSIPMVVMQENERMMPFMAMEALAPSLYDMTAQSTVIVQAKVKKIEKSVYEKENDIITTKVLLTAKEVYKGDKAIRSIELTVNGGYNVKADIYVPYDAVFEKNEVTLLFLNEANNGYILSDPMNSKYTYLSSENLDDMYQAVDGNTITISELKDTIKQQK